MRFTGLLLLVMILIIVSPVYAGSLAKNPVCSPAGYQQTWSDTALKNASLSTWVAPSSTIYCTGKKNDGTNVEKSGSYILVYWTGSSWSSALWDGNSIPYTGSPFNFTLSAGSHYYGFYNKYDAAWPSQQWMTNGSTPVTTPTASFSASPTTTFPNNKVGFTDSSSNTPTSWYWEFGDGNTSTLQNPSHLYNISGSYNVNLKVTNAAGSDWENKTGYITINDYVAPSCDFSINGSYQSATSPLVVGFGDDSLNNPTSYIWDFNPYYLSFFEITPQSYNTSSSAIVTITGSGILPVYHSVSNPAGTSICPIIYLNISGMVPTPTPTPAIPFPNQTGVCRGSYISLGSQKTRDFNSLLVLTQPDGSTKTDYIPSGNISILIGQNTRQLGQYYYAEYNESSQLLYQSSYIVEDCITYSPTPTYSVIPTISYTIIPTKTPVIPTTTIAITSNLNNTFSMPIQTFATLEPTRNTSGDVNITATRERMIELNPEFEVYINAVDSTFYPFYDFILTDVLPFITLFGFVNQVNWVITTFTLMLSSLSDIMFVTLLALNMSLAQLPLKVINTFTFLFTLDFIAQVRDLKSGRTI